MSYLAVIAIATGIPLFIPSLFHARVRSSGVLKPRLR